MSQIFLQCAKGHVRCEPASDGAGTRRVSARVRLTPDGRAFRGVATDDSRTGSDQTQHDGEFARSHFE
jgi:hypothetical protein